MKKNNSLYQNIVLTVLCLSLIVIAVIQVLQFRNKTAIEINGEYQINCTEKADSSTQPFLLDRQNTNYSGKQDCTIKKK